MYLENGKRYYFGQILLKRTTDKETSMLSTFNVFEIIDGQQRIASSLILLRCIVDELRSFVATDDGSPEHFENNYLKAGAFPKLSLLGDDEIMFNSIIFGKKELPEPRTESQRRLISARNFFKENLKEEKQAHPDSFERKLTELKDKLLGFEIIEYIVDNEAEAALMFETVNDRGKPLKALEKIKSLLMYMVYLSTTNDSHTETITTKQPESLLSQINSDFGSIFLNVASMGQELRRGRKLEEDFVQRAHHAILETGSPYSYDTIAVVKPKLTEMYKGKMRDELVRYVETYSSSISSTFKALAEILNYDLQSELGTILDHLFVLRSHEASLPLMISCWMTLQPEDLIRVYQDLEILLFRVYSLRVRTRSKVSEQLYRLAHDFYLHQITLDSVFASLRYLTKHYAADDFFRADVEDRQFYYNASKNVTKLIFYEYEKELKQKNGETLDVSLKEWLSDKYEIEHVWAQTAPVDGDDLEEYLNVGNKLGNLVIIPTELNQSLGNANFSLKRQHFGKHSLRSVKEIGGARVWREPEINSRTGHLREFIVRRWPLVKQ